MKMVKNPLSKLHFFHIIILIYEIIKRTKDIVKIILLYYFMRVVGEEKIVNLSDIQIIAIFCRICYRT